MCGGKPRSEAFAEFLRVAKQNKPDCFGFLEGRDFNMMADAFQDAVPLLVEFSFATPWSSNEANAIEKFFALRMLASCAFSFSFFAINK